MNKPRVYAMSFASVYPLYVAKAEKKGRTRAEVDQIIRWLTGYGPKELEAQKKKHSLSFAGPLPLSSSTATRVYWASPSAPRTRQGPDVMA